MVPWPTRVNIPNGVTIGSATFAGLTVVTDRQTDRPTDHATPSVKIGRIYTMLRRGLIIGLAWCDRKGFRLFANFSKKRRKSARLCRRRIYFTDSHDY